MEVKNVSETPFLFGFAPLSAEAEIPSGEFATVLAGISESRTPLSTMAEAVGLEPNVPPQKLDSPELRQGEVDMDLVPELHEVDQSLMTKPGGATIAPKVSSSPKASSATEASSAPKASSLESGFAAVEVLARTPPSQPSILQLPILQSEVAKLPPKPILTSRGRSEVSIFDTSSFIKEEVLSTKNEEVLPDELGPHTAALDQRFVDLQLLIGKELAQISPLGSPPISELDLNMLEPLVQVPIVLSPAANGAGQGEAPRLPVSSQLASTEGLVKTSGGVSPEIAGGVQRVRRTFENLRQLFGAVNENAKVRGGDLPFFEQVLKVSGLNGPLPRVDLNLPKVPGGTPMILQTNPGGESKVWTNAESLELNYLPGTKSTFAEVSEALGIIGISISQETTFEQESNPTTSIEIPAETAESPESKIFSPGPDFGARSQNSSTVNAPEIAPLPIEQVASRKVEAVPVETLPSSGFNQLSTSPDSVKKAIAHTWAVLDKSARKGLGTMPNQAPLDAKSYVATGESPPVLHPKGTESRLFEPVTTGSNLNSTPSSNQLLQPGNLVSNKPVQGLSKESQQGDQVSSAEAGAPLAGTRFHSESEGLVVGKAPELQVPTPSTLIVQTSASKLEPKGVVNKASDGRLAIEGNHSLLEIRSETVRKVAEHLDRLLVTRSKSESVIRMQPEELGSITLVVRNVKNDIEAVVTASDERVRELLHDARQDLVHNLQQKGHTDVRVTVSAEANSGDRQPSHRDASPGEHGQRHPGNSDFNSSSNGQSFSRDPGHRSQHGQQGSNPSQAFRFEDDRSLQPETAPSKKSETFRRFQKVIDVAI